MEIHGGDLVLALVVAAVTGLFSILWWFIRRQLATFQDMHKEHFRHSTDMSLHETERERAMRSDQRDRLAEQVTEHGRLDDQRFARIDTTLDEIRGDIKEILKEVSSK